MSEFRQYANSFSSQIAVRSSVLNPLLWLCGVAGVVFLSAAYSMPDYRGWLIICTVVPFIAAIFFYFYFAFVDPNRLQSEEFQVRQQELQLASKSGVSTPFSQEMQIEDHAPLSFLQQEHDIPDDQLILTGPRNTGGVE